MPIALGLGTAAAGIGSGLFGYMSANKAADTQAKYGQDTLKLQKDLADRQLALSQQAMTLGQAQGDRALNLGQDVGNRALALGQGVGNEALNLGQAAGERALTIGQGAGERALGLGIGAGREAAAGYSPYIGTGTNAFQSLAQLYGVPTPGNPEGGSSAINQGWSNFLNTPAYQFAVQQGNLGLDRSAASKGLLLSGGQLKDAMAFNQGLANQQIGNYTNILQNMATTGLQGVQGAASSLLGGYNAGISGLMGGTNTGISGLMSGTNYGIQGLLGGTDTGIRGLLGGTAGGISGMTGLTGAGIGALTGAAGNLGGMANTLGNTNQGIGQSLASGTVGGANALTGGVNNATSNALLAYGISRMPNNNTAANNPNPSSYQPAGSPYSLTPPSNFSTTTTGGLY